MLGNNAQMVSVDYLASIDQDNSEAENPRQMQEVVGGARNLPTPTVYEIDTTLTLGGIWIANDINSLIPDIGRDNSINCLIRCSRADYGAIACLNRSFYSLIKSGVLYMLRRKYGAVEHWIYFSCHLLQWEVFDPNCRRWMSIPEMKSNDCFMFSDKESLAVGYELLVFGRGLMAHEIHCYSLLTNSWTIGMTMKKPRCLFASASHGEIGILAGGCDSKGNVLDSVEMYDSNTGKWTLLPSMTKPRKMCSGVFMDGKFYVFGGTRGESNSNELLTCAEEYNLATKTWTKIPNVSPLQAREAESTPNEAPPLIAVVNNQLYAADYADMVVRKFDKEKKVWITLGALPNRADSMYGWGLAFRGCGDRLVVIGGPRNATGSGYVEVNAWVPNDNGPPQWQLLGQKYSGNFVYNCAIMGC